MERDEVEAAVHAAFARVRLGGGMSLRQAQAADTWRDGHTDAEWRALPRAEVTDDWSLVPEAELRRDCAWCRRIKRGVVVSHPMWWEALAPLGQRT